ncbi:MAG: hypothetical protein DCC68_26270 [Planctomycetota bacterium]|nr:MAG: hypothetical protein DCC68_26270 [Planctomycetota bacterium]
MKYDIQLTIDGVVHDPRAGSLLGQRHANPGGHAYEIRIHGHDVAATWFEEFSIGEHRKLGGFDKAILFLGVDAVIKTSLLSRTSCEPMYFFNTVRRLVVTAHCIEIEGDCSPIQRP